MRFETRRGRVAPVTPKPAPVDAKDLRAAFRRSRVRTREVHVPRYQRTLERVFHAEATKVARRFKQKATSHDLTAAAPMPASTMVAVYPTMEQAAALAQPNGEPVEIIHCTIAFLGELDADQAETVFAVLAALAPDLEPLEGVVGGVATFGSETGVQAEVARVADLVKPDGGYGETAYHSETSAVWWIPADWTSIEEAEAAEQAFLAIPQVQKVVVDEAESVLPDAPGWVPVFAGGRPLVEPSYPSIALPDVPYLADLRAAVCSALAEAGIEYSNLHGWTPHITLAYTREPTPPPTSLIGQPLAFDRLYLTRGDIPRSVPLGSLVAAADPPNWTPPHPDEVFQPEKFADDLRTKSDRVRQAVIESAMKDGLDLAGLSFDVTNPLVSGVLTKTGAKVTEISDTTRVGVMRAIGYAYDQGLSIPDAAKLLRDAMRDASPARSELIARTELAALENGGEVAAAKLVGEETGQGYWKRWLVGEGAEIPRHEEYEGLDQQTVEIDDVFDVGGTELDYPGDPNGPPDEVCNCRCAAVIVESQDSEIEVEEMDTG